jgi:DNA transformation protein
MATASDGFKDFVLDQLDGLRGVTCRAMFGGYGLYRGGVFFGIIHKSRLYFKTDETSRGAYAEHGMKPFRPNRRQTLKTYYEVPVEIIEDGNRLAAWATRAVPGRRRL